MDPGAIVSFAVLVIATLVASVAALHFARLLAAERRRGAGELKEQTRVASDVFDSLPIGIAMRDLDGRYVFVNRAWEAFTGARRQDVVGRTVHDRAPKAEADAVVAEDRAAIARGAAEPVKMQELLHRGRHFLLSRTVLADSRGRPTGVLVASVDTSDRFEMEKALRDRVKFVGELVDALPISVAMRDTEGRYQLVNRMWEHYFAIRREEALGRRRRELPGATGDAVRAGDAERIEALDRQLIESGPAYVPEPRELERLGRCFLISSRAMFDSSGTPVGVLSAGIETTERRAMEEELAFEQRRFEFVARATRVGIVDWDGSTHRTFYSPRFREILGHAPDADTSRWPDYFKVLIHPDDRGRVTARWREFVFGKGPEGRLGELYAPEEYRLLKKDGGYVWVEASGVAVRDHKGFVTRWIAAISDVTERRAQEEGLRASVRLREEVERMSRHDLKTPLNSVIAMSRLLREGGKLAPEDAELLGTIERAGYRILNMVNLSLDLFRMESGTWQFRPQAVDLSLVAQKVAADLESQAASKNVDVRVRSNNASAASNPVLARADELLCYSMLANLVKNAIEAAPEGSAVSLSLEKIQDWVEARVHNRGAVADEMRERFFQKYATAGKNAGLGLGTYSARLMARVQEGDVTLQTSAAQGTTLTVRLKAAAASEAAPARIGEAAAARGLAQARASLPPLKVLVVDDDEFNRLVLRRTLPHPPLTLTMAVNGRAALEAAERDWPDVVLLDLEMPVMDGYETARLLRKKEAAEKRRRVTIVAISSNDEQAIIDKALAAGCDQYLMKPAPREVLWRLLAGTQDAAPQRPGAPRTPEVADAVLLDPDLADVMPEFLASRRALLEDLAGALEANDRVRFKQVAHGLAGGFSLYGFAWAAAQCRALSREAAMADAGELARRVAAVREHLERVPMHYASAAGAGEGA